MNGQSMYQTVDVRHLDRKKAHLTALAVHRGGGARIEYLQGISRIKLKQGGSTLPDCFSMPLFLFHSYVK